MKHKNADILILKQERKEKKMLDNWFVLKQRTNLSSTSTIVGWTFWDLAGEDKEKEKRGFSCIISTFHATKREK